MRTRFLGLAFAVLAAANLVAGSAAAAEPMQLAGTGGAMPMATRVAAGFAVETGVEIEVVPGLGSGGAIRAASDGTIDLAISARPLTEAESALGLVGVPFARTALVFVTSLADPNGIESADLPGLFASADPKWADGSPMRIILRTRLDGDTILLETLFAGMKEAIAAARLRPEIPVAATDQDSADLAERLPGSFVQAGYSQIITEKRNLRFVAIDGVAPTPENFAAGTYPYEKDFYLVYAGDRAADAERLLEFLRSSKGESILRGTGNLPIAK